MSVANIRLGSNCLPCGVRFIAESCVNFYREVPNMGRLWLQSPHSPKESKAPPSIILHSYPNSTVLLVIAFLHVAQILWESYTISHSIGTHNAYCSQHSIIRLGSFQRMKAPWGQEPCLVHSDSQRTGFHIHMLNVTERLQLHGGAPSVQRGTGYPLV